MSVFFINPFAFAAADGDYESIATVTVGSGGASSIEFTSIASTYQHLQVRFLHRSNRSGAANENVKLTVNGETGSNFAYHRLEGNGSSAVAAGASSQVDIRLTSFGATATTSAFVACIIDILDYASTSKATTFRVFSGREDNTSGNGLAQMLSGLWTSTDAVTSIKLVPSSGPNWIEHTTAALYGIKAP